MNPNLNKLRMIGGYAKLSSNWCVVNTAVAVAVAWYCYLENARS